MIAAVTRIPFLLPELGAASSDESNGANVGAEAADISVKAAAAGTDWRIAGLAGDASGILGEATTMATACSASHAVVGICGFGTSLAGAGALAAPPDVRIEEENAGRASFPGVVAEIDGSLGLRTASFFSTNVAAFCRGVLPVGFETGCHGYCW